MKLLKFYKNDPDKRKFREVWRVCEHGHVLTEAASNRWQGYAFEPH